MIVLPLVPILAAIVLIIASVLSATSQGVTNSINTIVTVIWILVVVIFVSMDIWRVCRRNLSVGERIGGGIISVIATAQAVLTTYLFTSKILMPEADGSVGFIVIAIIFAMISLVSLGAYAYAIVIDYDGYGSSIKALIIGFVPTAIMGAIIGEVESEAATGFIHLLIQNTL